MLITEKQITQIQLIELIDILKNRFDKNMNRHKKICWELIEKKIRSDIKKQKTLYNMESTGGEPDVGCYEKETDEYIFYDFSKESPEGRRNLCYDREALESRKTNKPQSSALEMADEIGIEILTEDQYRKLQMIETFDTKTSSWIKTPAQIRELGGALFCDHRYGTVFTYHNGASSYYGVRGFRGMLRV